MEYTISYTEYIGILKRRFEKEKINKGYVEKLIILKKYAKEIYKRFEIKFTIEQTEEELGLETLKK